MHAMVLILLFFFKFSISGKKTTKNEYKFHPYGVSQIIKEKLLKWMFISYPLALHLNFSTEIPSDVYSKSVIFLYQKYTGKNVELKITITHSDGMKKHWWSFGGPKCSFMRLTCHLCMFSLQFKSPRCKEQNPVF